MGTTVRAEYDQIDISILNRLLYSLPDAHALCRRGIVRDCTKFGIDFGHFYVGELLSSMDCSYAVLRDPGVNTCKAWTVAP